MEYEETDSDDDSKLQIVEAGSPSLRMEDGGMSSKATLIPRTLMRSLSAVESMKEDYHMGGGLASDAVESLLLLGQTPIIAPKLEDKVRWQIYDPFQSIAPDKTTLQGKPSLLFHKCIDKF